ncbi:UNVERIFIED_CONTAM: hypothetical protein FKN15_035230 [Acipenser sinensis]
MTLLYESTVALTRGLLLPLCSDDGGATPVQDEHEGSDAEGGSPAQRSGSEAGSVGLHSERRIESDEEADSDKENGREQNGVVSSDSEDEAKPLQAGGSDSEEGEAPKRRKLVDSDEEEEGEKPVKRKKVILSDSEDEEKEETSPVKKSRILSDGEESDTNRKLKALGSDSEDEEDKGGSTKDGKTLFGSDSESDNEEEKMIADIFGESGEEDEEEEFTGFNQEDLEGEKSKADAASRQQQVAAADSDSDDVERGGSKDFMSDFDVMLARKKAQGGKRRRNRDGGTFISDADDVVSAMIAKMTEAAEEDRTLNGQKKPALKKLTLLPTVVMHLKKQVSPYQHQSREQHLKETFIDSGVMSAIKEWIGPLPDKSLPALKIREELLRILQELPSVSQETLKHSGIGRAVMYLYKHPKESRSNKDLAGKLISYDSSGGQTPRRDLDKVLTGEEKALRPGEPGFCARARVPMPSNKDYVVRPRWNVDTEANRVYENPTHSTFITLSRRHFSQTHESVF